MQVRAVLASLWRCIIAKALSDRTVSVWISYRHVLGAPSLWVSKSILTKQYICSSMIPSKSKTKTKTKTYLLNQISLELPYRQGERSVIAKGQKRFSFYIYERFSRPAAPYLSSMKRLRCSILAKRKRFSVTLYI